MQSSYRILKVVKKGVEKYKVQEYNLLNFYLFKIGFWSTMDIITRDWEGDYTSKPAKFEYQAYAEKWLADELFKRRKKKELSKINFTEVVKEY